MKQFSLSCSSFVKANNTLKNNEYIVDIRDSNYFFDKIETLIVTLPENHEFKNFNYKGTELPLPVNQVIKNLHFQWEINGKKFREFLDNIQFIHSKEQITFT